MTTVLRARRVLITGSRDWRDVQLLKDALMRVSYSSDGDPILVSGHCPTGADAMAEDYWERHLHLRVERHPADWARHGKKAGFVRNAEMVELGADICLAFIRNKSKGATMTMNMAVASDIPVLLYREDDDNAFSTVI